MLRALLTDGSGHDVDIDSRSSSLGVIEVEHKRVHHGEAFHHQDFVNLASGNSRQFIFTTPNTTIRIHFTTEIDFESETSVIITEGVSTDADGTAIAGLNRDRNNATAATLVLTHTPTNPTGGTVISSIRKGSGKKAGGLNRSAEEIIFKQNTKYLIDITNESVGESLTNWLFNWYEEK